MKKAIFLIIMAVFVIFGCKKEKESPVLSIDKTTIAAGSDDSKYQVKITSNIEWKALSEEEWCVVTPAKGNDNGEISVSVERNPSITERTANIHISGDGADRKTIRVTQAKSIPVLSVDQNAITADKKAGTYTVKITSNIPWKISYPSPSWCTPSVVSGNGNETLTLSVLSENTTNADRMMVFTLEGDGTEVSPQTITITQTTRILTGITITTLPAKCIFEKGALSSVNDLDISDLVVTGLYDTGNSAPVTITHAQLSTTDNLSTGGEKTIKISIGDQTATFAITVRTVTGIVVTTLPAKTIYDMGELPAVSSLDLRQMVVTASYNTGTPAPVTVTHAQLSTTDNLSTGGEKTIRITFDGKTTTFKIRVRILQQITITEPPRRTVYATGELFSANNIDLSGIVVTGTYDAGDPATVNITTSQLSSTGSLSTVGEKTIRITANGVTTSFNITVSQTICRLGTSVASYTYYTTLEEAIGVAKELGGSQTITLLSRMTLTPQVIDVNKLVLTITCDTPYEVKLSGTGSMFTVGGLNNTNRDVWLKLNGKITLRGLATAEYGGTDSENNTEALITVRNDGKLELNGNTIITGNANVGSSYRYGGGVCANSSPVGGYLAKVYINDHVRITNNVVESSDKYTRYALGGGVYLGHGVMTMEGGEISGNTAEGGGGVCLIAAGVFHLKGGTIQNNTLKYARYPEGGGVFVGGTAFVISGNASIPSAGSINTSTRTDTRNTVYLCSNHYKIGIVAPLTAPGKAATIDLYGQQWEDKPLLKKFDYYSSAHSDYTGTGTDIAPTDKFSLGKFIFDQSPSPLVTDISGGWKADGSLATP